MANEWVSWMELRLRQAGGVAAVALESIFDRTLARSLPSHPLFREKCRWLCRDTFLSLQCLLTAIPCWCNNRDLDCLRGGFLKQDINALSNQVSRMSKCNQGNCMEPNLYHTNFNLSPPETHARTSKPTLVPLWQGLFYVIKRQGN